MAPTIGGDTAIYVNSTSLASLMLIPLPSVFCELHGATDLEEN